MREREGLLRQDPRVSPKRPYVFPGSTVTPAFVRLGGSKFFYKFRKIPAFGK
jgi:hypothetical protein